MSTANVAQLILNNCCSTMLSRVLVRTLSRRPPLRFLAGGGHGHDHDDHQNENHDEHHEWGVVEIPPLSAQELNELSNVVHSSLDRLRAMNEDHAPESITLNVRGVNGFTVPVVAYVGESVRQVVARYGGRFPEYPLDSQCQGEGYSLKKYAYNPGPQCMACHLYVMDDWLPLLEEESEGEIFQKRMIIHELLKPK